MQKFLYKGRGFLAVLAAIAFLGVFSVGVVRLVSYTLPLYLGHPDTAAQSDYGDKVVAYYDAALQQYKAHQYDVAAQLAAKAYSTLTAQTGSIPTTARAQSEAADIQFLLGISREKNKQQSQAVDAYKQALRHNPDHLAAKYNLERLTKPSSGGGGGGAGKGDGAGQGGNQPGQQPGGGASHQGKKGI